MLSLCSFGSQPAPPPAPTGSQKFRMSERDNVIQSADQIKKLKEDNARMKKELKPLTKQAKQADNLRPIVEQAQTDNAELRARVQATQSENDKVREMWTADVEQLNTQIETSEARIKDLDHKNAHLSSTVSAMEEQIAASKAEEVRLREVHRVECERMREEYRAEREQARRLAEEQAEAERLRKLETARQARKQDVALEEYILQLVNQTLEGHQDLDDQGEGGEAEVRRRNSTGGSASAGGRSRGPPSSSFTTPSSPPESEQEQKRTRAKGGAEASTGRSSPAECGECPHCGACSPSLPPSAASVGDADQRQPSARHQQAVQAALDDWEQRERSPSPTSTRSPRSPRSAGPGILSSPGSLAPEDRQRRADWIRGLLELGRDGEDGHRQQQGSGGRGVAEWLEGRAGGEERDWDGRTAREREEERARELLETREREREQREHEREQRRKREQQERQQQDRERERERAESMRAAEASKAARELDAEAEVAAAWRAAEVAFASGHNRPTAQGSGPVTARNLVGAREGWPAPRSGRGASFWSPSHTERVEPLSFY